MNKQSIWNRRIPSVFGIAILIGGIALTAWFAQTGVIFTGRASPGNMPIDVTVTNISDRSFTVSYITTDSVLGTITYSEPGEEEIVAVDERDQKSGQPQAYTAHSIAIRNLKSGTRYTFSINSGGGTFRDTDQPYTVSTGDRLTDAPPTNQPVTGKIITQDGKAPDSAIVYLQTDNSQVLSALVQPDGTYAIPVESFRTKDLTSYEDISEETEFRIRIASTQGKTSLTVPASNSNPIPLTTLARTYDFSTTSESTTMVTSSESANVTGFPDIEVTDDTQAVTTVQITTPKVGQSLTDQRPVFKGKAPPRSEVELTINADDPIQANIIADRRGNWSYRPAAPLSAGQLEVTATARDGTGIVKTQTQSFTILTSGSRFTEPSVSPVAPSTTPSPSPTKKPSPTLSPTAKPTSVPTPTGSSPTATPAQSEPTASPVPSVTATVPTATPTIITATPTPTVIVPTGSQPPVSPQPSIDPSGSYDGILYTLIGTIAVAIGAALVFLTGGIPL